MKILGISAFYHDSAAAIIDDGIIVAAAQEERFSRKKHDERFPHNAVRYCLETANCRLSEVDHVVFYEKPFLKFERLLETYLAFAPRGFGSFVKAMPLWIKEKLFQKEVLARELKRFDPDFDGQAKLLFAEHHQSHAASAFYPSPFEEALVITMDGVGEWATASVGIGKNNALSLVKEIHFPHSLGLLYSAFTYYTGFKVNSGEYKVMGLAPYGTPRYADLILRHLIDLKDDGSFRLNMQYFDYCTGLTMTNKKFHALFEGEPRKPEEPLTQRDMDLAASVQCVIEKAILQLVRASVAEYGLRNVCMAGGVALNCVANGRILKEKICDRLWIQPAAGDAGGALGAALAVWHDHLGSKRIASRSDAMRGAYLGPGFSDEKAADILRAAGAVFTTLPDDGLLEETKNALVSHKIVGWFQGRMEFGPRALGNRSIIADPRSPDMQKKLNLKIKFRESFRPFAPSVLADHARHWFDLDEESPYMLLVADVHPAKRIEMTSEQKALFGLDKLNQPRSEIPAVTHVDYSARIQTVHAETNARYHDLIDAFYRSTGCPMLVNTSFNIRGEPMVCSPEDAYRCFMGTDMDILVVGNHFLRKEEQPSHLRNTYSERFSLD